MFRSPFPLTNFYAAALVFLALPVLAGEVPVRQDLGEAMPQVLYSSNAAHSFATWVSASAALEPSGSFDERLFHPQIREKLDYHLSQEPSADGCIPYGPVYFDLVGAPDWSTRQKVFLNSELVVYGTVVGKEYGFKGSVPGQLLKLETKKVYKGDREHLPAYYVFFPVGEFQVEDLRICKTDNRYPPPPEIGDELIVSVPRRSNPDESLLEPDLVSGHGFITLKDSRAYWSPELGDESSAETDRGAFFDLMTSVLEAEE